MGPKRRSLAFNVPLMARSKRVGGRRSWVDGWWVTFHVACSYNTTAWWPLASGAYTWVESQTLAREQNAAKQRVNQGEERLENCPYTLSSVSLVDVCTVFPSLTTTGNLQRTHTRHETGRGSFDISFEVERRRVLYFPFALD